MEVWHYSLAGYGSMISDRGRTDAYARALQAIIRPTSVVLDIGTGMGLFALLACKFGARKVYAVEPADVINLAREVTKANGFAERIEFVQALSDQINLPEKVDVIVSDIRGILPLCQRSIQVLIDARNRFLVPGGRMIPACDTLWAALVNAPDLYQEFTKPWEESLFGLDLGLVRNYALNYCGKNRLATESSYVVEPQRWVTLDYGTISVSNAAGQLCWTVDSPGTAHGALVWFDCETSEGLGYSSSPASERHSAYGQLFFPFLDAVSLQSGDQVELKLAADVIREDYFWRWETRIVGATGSLKSEFHQSSLAGAMLSRAQLRKRGHSFVAQLNTDAQVDKFILERMAAALTLGDVARELVVVFPGRFADWHDALCRVADLSAKYAV